MNINHSKYQIKLIPYQEKDRADFVVIFMNEEICQHMAGGAFEKEIDAEKLFYHLLELNFFEETISNSYGVFCNKELIGHFEINQNNFTKVNELEIVYLLVKEYWGKGIMKNVIAHFQEKYAQKIIARVEPNNFNSLKMLEKLGIEKQTLTKFNNNHVIKITLKGLS